jgi:hypothetical protein
MVEDGPAFRLPMIKTTPTANPNSPAAPIHIRRSIFATRLPSRLATPTGAGRSTSGEIKAGSGKFVTDFGKCSVSVSRLTSSATPRGRASVGCEMYVSDTGWDVSPVGMRVSVPSAASERALIRLLVARPVPMTRSARMTSAPLANRSSRSFAVRQSRNSW